jgi:hypothetical protein
LVQPTSTELVLAVTVPSIVTVPLWIKAPVPAPTGGPAGLQVPALFQLAVPFQMYQLTAQAELDHPRTHASKAHFTTTLRHRIETLSALTT